MNVTNLKAGALTGQTTRSKGGETALMRDLRQWIGLIHELRQLAGPEEFANRGHNGLRIYQVMRHRCRHFLIHRHLFLDGPFHADQTDAELIFQQFAHGADAAVTQMIDVIHQADTLAQTQQVADCGNKIVTIKRTAVQRIFLAVSRISLVSFRSVISLIVQLNVELHASDAG